MSTEPYTGPAGGLADPNRPVAPLVAAAVPPAYPAPYAEPAPQAPYVPAAFASPAPAPAALPAAPAPVQATVSSPRAAAALGLAPAPAGPSEAAVLAARGVEIPLASGPALLRYDFRALLVIEEDFGSIGAMQKALSGLTDSGLNRPVLREVARILQAGLLDHFPEGPDGTRAVIAQLLIEHLPTYTTALGRAFEVAFGALRGEAPAGPSQDGGAGGEGPFPGGASTTSPSSPQG